jgi:hypothetical protein
MVVALWLGPCVDRALKEDRKKTICAKIMGLVKILLPKTLQKWLACKLSWLKPMALWY